MRIVETYSHLNGEEYLLVHHKAIYREIKEVISRVSAQDCMTKTSREKTMRGRKLFDPTRLNAEFRQAFNARGWTESRYKYYVTTDRKILQQIVNLPYAEQREHLLALGKEPIHSYKQTDFVKDSIAIEVQFGKYAFVAFDLFVKHLLFYAGGIINLGIEILPMKEMSRGPEGRLMSTGIAYYEGEVYNILRHGRNSPPVPLLILGIAP